MSPILSMLLILLPLFANIKRFFLFKFQKMLSFLVVFFFFSPRTHGETLEEFMEKEAQLLSRIFTNYSADLPATYTRGWKI